MFDLLRPPEGKDAWVESGFGGLSQQEAWMSQVLEQDAMWLHRAAAGKPESAYSPASSGVSVKTPAPATVRFDYKAVDATPPPVIQPYQKAALQAQSRLNHQVKTSQQAEEKPESAKGIKAAKRVKLNGEKVGKEIEQQAISVKESKLKRPEVPAEPVVNGVEFQEAAANEKVKKTKTSSKEEKPGKAKKPRAPNDGPMEVVMNEFMKNMVAEGHTWKEGRKRWMQSDERAYVISQLSEAERKRRRYG